ncbi:Rapamycin-insensitive companion of mTOR, N-term-domain-containing protein [Abortiporus biennis]|nr:Rapamycin-insensitive companion of mTOR, N-term-domain-containing protein [Abortiporus biennis]
MPALVLEPQIPNGGLNVPRNDLSSTASTAVNSIISSTSTAVNGSTSGERLIPMDRSTTGERAGADSSIEARPNGVSQQLEDLNNQLKFQNRIKEGAENMLQMQLPENLRLQVETELENARHNIDDISKRIESHTTRERKKRNFHGQHIHSHSHSHSRTKDGLEDRDDFRTALQQASTFIRNLSSTSSLNLSPSNGPSTSTSSNLEEPELSRSRIQIMNQLINVLQRNLRVRYEIVVADVIQAVQPALSDRSTKQCRAAAYRLIRHLLVDSHSVEVLQEQELDWYIVRSLARDNKHSVEKEQVIKLLRAMVEIGSQRKSPHGGVALGCVPLSDPIMRAMVAVAEHPDDPFKHICVQTLAEILLIDVELTARTGGTRVLLHALAEGPLEMAPLIASAFLYIADSPKTRTFLNPGTDLEMALSGVTDAYGKGADYVDRMRGSIKIIASMLRTWSGLMYFCIQDKLAIRGLVNVLRIPSLDTRDIVLDMFCDLLNIRPPEWHKAFIDGRRLTMYRRSRDSKEPSDQNKQRDVQSRPQETLKLTDQYIALLVLIFSNVGLIDALTEMLEEPSIAPNLSRKATLLIAEILQISNRVLPLSIASKIQALPRVFNLASDYKFGENRIVGTSALSAIDSYTRHRSRTQPTVIVKDFARPRANSVEDAVRRRERQVEQAKIKVGMQMDDKLFQTSLLETQVMLTKDHTKWNFEAIQELIDGPLLNAKRMEEAIKVSRFMRKLMSFFYPFNHKFSDMPRMKQNLRWVRLGCNLLNALISSPEGTKFLDEDDLLNQIVKSFAQLDPFNGNPTSDPIFSKRRMQETLTYGYFEMLGVLSKRKEGLELLEKFKLFTAFYHLSELRSREDLIKGIIENLDYSIDGHSRIVLSKALTSAYMNIRLYATNHLGELIRASSLANAWTLRLLLTQLYDPAIEVQELAVKYLEEACEYPDVLQIVVEMHPTLDHLGEVGHPLLLKFMSTTLGFRYLYAADYIDREMDVWFHERNLHYVVHIEVFLSKAFGFTPTDDDDDFLSFEGIVPPHFYGVMAKTDLGCQVLGGKGHFAEFAAFIRQHGLESEDQDLIMKLKSVLWAVGNVGAAEKGLPFLEEEELIPAILEIVEQSLVLSVRGTCFFVLGLISSTPQGAEILDDYHWEATLSPLGQPTGLCVPVNVDKFVSIPPWHPTPISEEKVIRLRPPENPEEIEVMTAIYNLANTVIANTASRSLTKMKQRPEYKHIFSSTKMFYRAMHTISSQRYRLPVRRYILDLFNVELCPEVIKELREHESELKIGPAEEAVAVAPAPRVVSMLPARNNRISDSDDESVMDEEGGKPEVEKHPVLNLAPVRKIVGFEDGHSDSEES